MSRLTGKQIDAFVNGLDHKTKPPSYFGDKYFPPNYDIWQKEAKKVNGAFLARKYNGIMNLIKETQASIKVVDEALLINYANGSAKISRDILVDTFLIPELYHNHES